ncbi:MAG: DUF2325 domain-containing protein [Polyangiaceae bacterium]
MSAITNHRPRIAIIGGAERVERTFRELALELGVDVDLHDGHMHGRGNEKLSNQIRRADLVLVVTGINSHNAVRAAKREAARFGAPVRILKSCGAGVARDIMNELRGVQALRPTGT